MALIEDDQVVQAFAAQHADQRSAMELAAYASWTGGIRVRGRRQ